MRVNGKMIKHMGKGNIFTLMVPIIKEIGIKICNMVLVKKYGLMVHHTKGNFILGKNKAKENLLLLMAVSMKENFMKTTCMEKELTHGQMEEYIKDPGCRAK